jgi:hypothetical protein
MSAAALRVGTCWKPMYLVLQRLNCGAVIYQTGVSGGRVSVSLHTQLHISVCKFYKEQCTRPKQRLKQGRQNQNRQKPFTHHVWHSNLRIGSAYKACMMDNMVDFDQMLKAQMTYYNLLVAEGTTDLTTCKHAQSFCAGSFW